MLYITFVETEFQIMKVQTAFRLDKELIERIREKAKAQKRSFNNYGGYLFYKDVGDIPNNETVKAVEDARRGQGLEQVDDLDNFLDQL